MQAPYRRFLLAFRAMGKLWSDVNIYLSAIGFPKPDDDLCKWADATLEAKPEFFAPELQDPESLLWLRNKGIEEPWTDPEAFAAALDLPIEQPRLVVEMLLLAGLEPFQVVPLVQTQDPNSDLTEQTVELYERFLFCRGAMSPSGWEAFLKDYEPAASGDLYLAYTSGPQYVMHHMGVDIEIDRAKIVRSVIKEAWATMQASRGMGDFENTIRAGKGVIDAIRAYAEVTDDDLTAALEQLKLSYEVPRMLEGSVVDGVIVPPESASQQL